MDVKCMFLHCKHDSRDLPAEEAVKVGNHYYHKDCYELKQKLDDTVQYYVDNFDKRASVPQLRKTVSAIVLKSDNPEFLHYAMRYAKQYNIPVKHPSGLYALVNNENIKSSFTKYIAKKYREAIGCTTVFRY